MTENSVTHPVGFQIANKPNADDTNGIAWSDLKMDERFALLD